MPHNTASNVPKNSWRGFFIVIGNELEQEIISLYAQDLSSLYSINQIAQKRGKKYPYINKKVSALIDEGIFRKSILGRSYLCSLNLDNDEAIYLLILYEIKKKKTALKKESHLAEILDYISKINKIISLPLVVESEKKIIFVLEKQEGKEQFEKAVVKEAMKGYTTEATTKEHFLKELLKNKEVQKNHVILHGYEKYYEYMCEIEDELKARYSKIL